MVKYENVHLYNLKLQGNSGIATILHQAWQPPYFIRGATNLREANESAESLEPQV